MLGRLVVKPDQEERLARMGIKDKNRIYEAEDLAPGKQLTVVLNHKDGSVDYVKLNHTYNKQQIEWFKAGGALNIIRKQMAS